MSGNILDELLSAVSMSQSELADYLGITRQSVNAWKTKKKFSNAIIKKMEELTKEKNVSLQFLETGKGPVIINHDQDYSNTLKNYTLDDTTDEYTSRKIPYIDTIDIFATISPAMADAVAMKANTFISIPIFSKGEFAIQVKGNSMKGHINNGDWVVIRRIYDVERIIYGEPYVVCTRSNNLRTVKFVKQHEDDALLWLCPYNIDQFDAQYIEKEDIIEMYAIEGLFRGF